MNTTFYTNSDDIRAKIDQFTLVFKNQEIEDLYKNDKNTKQINNSILTSWNNTSTNFINKIIADTSLSLNDNVTKSHALPNYSDCLDIVFGSSKINLGYSFNRIDMGICLMVKAGALTEYALNTNKPVYELIRELLSYGSELGFVGHISRLDVAIDLFNQHFTVNGLQRKLTTNKVTVQDINGNNIRMKLDVDSYANNGITNTIYIGSVNYSRLRIYNKKYEQETNPRGMYKDLASANDSWIRIEYEIKKEKAKSLTNTFINLNSIQEFTNVLFRLIADNFIFVNVKTGKILPFSKKILDRVNNRDGKLFNIEKADTSISLKARAEYFKNRSGFKKFFEQAKNDPNFDDQKFLAELLGN